MITGITVFTILNLAKIASDPNSHFNSQFVKVLIDTFVCCYLYFIFIK